MSDEEERSEGIEEQTGLVQGSDKDVRVEVEKLRHIRTGDIQRPGLHRGAFPAEGLIQLGVAFSKGE